MFLSLFCTFYDVRNAIIRSIAYNTLSFIIECILKINASASANGVDEILGWCLLKNYFLYIHWTLCFIQSAFARALLKNLSIYLSKRKKLNSLQRHVKTTILCKYHTTKTLKCPHVQWHTYIQMIYNAHNVKQNDWIWGAIQLCNMASLSRHSKAQCQLTRAAAWPCLRQRKRYTSVFNGDSG